MQDYRPLGGILIDKGKLTQEQLDAALQVRRGQKRRLGDVLVAYGFVTEDDVAESLAEQYDLKVVDVANAAPDPIALRLLDAGSALKSRILPLKFGESKLECVIADPIDVSAMDMVARATSREVVFHIAPITALLQAIRVAYGLPVVDRRTSRVNMTSKHNREDRGALLDLIDSELGVVVMPLAVMTSPTQQGQSTDTSEREVGVAL